VRPGDGEHEETGTGHRVIRGGSSSDGPDLACSGRRLGFTPVWPGGGYVLPGASRPEPRSEVLRFAVYRESCTAEGGESPAVNYAATTPNDPRVTDERAMPSRMHLLPHLNACGKRTATETQGPHGQAREGLRPPI
jgi:hypothetical protein